MKIYGECIVCKKPVIAEKMVHHSLFNFYDLSELPYDSIIYKNGTVRFGNTYMPSAACTFVFLERSNLHNNVLKKIGQYKQCRQKS